MLHFPDLRKPDLCRCLVMPPSTSIQWLKYTSSDTNFPSNYYRCCSHHDMMESLQLYNYSSSSEFEAPSGFLKTTLLGLKSRIVLQFAYGKTSSKHCGRVTLFTGSSNFCSSSSQFLSHIPCGLGSMRITHSSRSPSIAAMMRHAFSQFDVSSRYASLLPRRRYGNARTAQRNCRRRIVFRRGCGRDEGR